MIVINPALADENIDRPREPTIYTSHRIKMCKRGFSQSRKAAKDNELIISKL